MSLIPHYGHLHYFQLLRVIISFWDLTKKILLRVIISFWELKKKRFSSKMEYSGVLTFIFNYSE